MYDTTSRGTTSTRKRRQRVVTTSPAPPAARMTTTTYRRHHGTTSSSPQWQRRWRRVVITTCTHMTTTTSCRRRHTTYVAVLPANDNGPPLTRGGYLFNTDPAQAGRVLLIYFSRGCSYYPPQPPIFCPFLCIYLLVLCILPILLFALYLLKFNCNSIYICTQLISVQVREKYLTNLSVTWCHRPTGTWPKLVSCPR